MRFELNEIAGLVVAGLPDAFQLGERRIQTSCPRAAINKIRRQTITAITTKEIIFAGVDRVRLGEHLGHLSLELRAVRFALNDAAPAILVPSTATTPTLVNPHCAQIINTSVNNCTASS